jgi:hypothetical protein
MRKRPEGIPIKDMAWQEPFEGAFVTLGHSSRAEPRHKTPWDVIWENVNAAFWRIRGAVINMVKERED